MSNVRSLNAAAPLGRWRCRLEHQACFERRSTPAKDRASCLRRVRLDDGQRSHRFLGRPSLGGRRTARAARGVVRVSLLAVLSAGWPCQAQSLVPARIVHSARQGAVLTTARARATRGPAEYRSAELQFEHAPASTPALVAPERSGCQNAIVRYHQASNPSIERTPSSRLRRLPVAAHVER